MARQPVRAGRSARDRDGRWYRPANKKERRHEESAHVRTGSRPGRHRPGGRQTVQCQPHAGHRHPADERDSQRLTLSIWGQNQQHSLAIGFVNGTSGDSSGLCIGLVNYGDKYTGVQWGIVNYEKGDFLGWQSAAVNYTDGMFTGFQSGWINYAGNLNGFQLGLVNIADQAKAALQIGLVNIIQQNTMWFRELPDALAPGMVIANWRF
jgi:hypothetical protein